MNINNFLSNRKSVREFREKSLNSDMLDKVRDILENMLSGDEKSYIDLLLYENGKMISENLQGKAGYGGVMINSPQYIAVKLRDREEKTVIEAGYYMQKLVTEIIKLDLGTCWITVNYVADDVKEKTFGENSKNIEYLLAIGKEKRRNPFEKKAFSVKKGVEELVYDGEIEELFDVEELESKGLMDIFFYVRFAPSTRNLQPWRFLIKDNTIELILKYEKWYESILIDAGIAMYYFEQLANYEGIKSKWELIDPLEVNKDQYTYRTIAQYKL